jgi:hypothetical protein
MRCIMLTTACVLSVKNFRCLFKDSNPWKTRSSPIKNGNIPMKKIAIFILWQTLLLSLAIFNITSAQNDVAHNPIIHADVPDMSMIRVGDAHYMSSTTMHMSPGVPIMKSTDLVNWQIVNYAYDTLYDVDALNLANGKSAYSRGSWASCIRYRFGLFNYATQTPGGYVDFGYFHINGNSEVKN